MRAILVFPVLVFVLGADAFGAQDSFRIPRRDESRVVRLVEFYGEKGFEDFLRNESGEAPGFDIDRIPDVQRPLFELEAWEQRMFPKFAVQLSMGHYYLQFGLEGGLVNRFYDIGVGGEITGFLHLDPGVDGFFSFDVSTQTGGKADLQGVPTSLGDITMYTMIIGLKPFASFRDLFGVDSAFTRSAALNLRFGAGPTFMQDVRRLRPLPEKRFWAAGTLGTIHVAVGFEYSFLDELRIFAEQGIRLYSSPHPTKGMRPDNEAGPFGLVVFQGGFFFRFG